MLDPVDDASAFDSLDERISGTVVGDGQSEGVFRFDYFHLLRSTFFVCEDEIVQTDLAAQQVTHVDLVGIQRAKQNL